MDSSSAAGVRAIGPFHWNNRKLSTHEMCRLQTFPDGLKFNCGRTNAQKMLGNAVPSLLAEVVAREIGRQVPRRDQRRRADLATAS
ncbi:DNA cytosine methyltransferase [Caulobacter segnis]